MGCVAQTRQSAHARAGRRTNHVGYLGAGDVGKIDPTAQKGQRTPQAQKAQKMICHSVFGGRFRGCRRKGHAFIHKYPYLSLCPRPTSGVCMLASDTKTACRVAHMPHELLLDAHLAPLQFERIVKHPRRNGCARGPKTVERDV